MFHSSNPTLFGRTEGVIGESAVLWRTIGGLRRISHELSENVDDANIEARRLLATLSTSLSTYFDTTEAQGYFATIVADCPGLLQLVGTLSDARERLKLSVTSARRLAFRTTDAAELGQQIDLVLDGFEEHEHSERDLLQRFFLYGGKHSDGRLDAS